MLTRRVGSCLFAAAIAAAAITPTNARAQDSSDAGRDSSQASSLADRLFEDGRALADRGDHESACAKFEASLKLDPRAVGTLLHIATCKEKTGKLATAWGLYGEVAMRSRGVRAERYELAEARRRDLALRLSSILLRPPARRPPGFKVMIDGLPLDEAAWSSSLPVDGGEHAIEASAPGFTPYRTTVRVAPEKQTLELPLPPLAPAAASAPSAANAPANANANAIAPEPTRSNALGITLVGVGAVALGIGGGLGIDVLTRGDWPRAACPDPCVRGSAEAEESQRRYDALKRESLAANILVPVGAVASAAGVWLWLVAPPSSRARAGSSAGVGAWVNGANAGVSGAF